MDVLLQVELVKERVARSCERCGRDPAGVTLIAATKWVPVERIRHAIAAGVRDLGENRAQEAVAKYKEIGNECRWHFIGHLQRNKVASVSGFADLIHTVDSQRLLWEIDRQATASGRIQDVLIQVDAGVGTPANGTRHGVNPDEVESLLEAACEAEHVRPAGLMAMAPHDPDPEHARPYFQQLARRREELQSQHQDLVFEHLSMGMSGDFEVAIEEGSTMVRLGQVIFGPRANVGPPAQMP